MAYSYFNAPATAYPYFDLPHKPEHPYTPQDDVVADPIDAYNDPNVFPSFDPSFQFAPNTLVQQPQSPPASIHRQSMSHMLTQHDSSGSGELNGDYDNYEPNQARSSDGDDDKDGVTPAQSRRKAQNRAAQRAFRERKERRVKDLEIQLESIKSRETNFMTENEKLKRENERLQTQNEIYRVAGVPAPSHHSPPAPPSPVPGPQSYSPTTFHQTLSSVHPGAATQPMSHRVNVSARTGEKLLATGATWDLIHNHDLFQKGMVDVSQVVERLKDQWICDGTGPTFPESAVIKAIEDSVGGPPDELI